MKNDEIDFIFKCILILEFSMQKERKKYEKMLFFFKVS